MQNSGFRFVKPLAQWLISHQRSSKMMKLRLFIPEKIEKLRKEKNANFPEHKPLLPDKSILLSNFFWLDVAAQANPLYVKQDLICSSCRRLLFFTGKARSAYNLGCHLKLVSPFQIFEQRKADYNGQKWANEVNGWITWGRNSGHTLVKIRDQITFLRKKLPHWLWSKLSEFTSKMSVRVKAQSEKGLLIDFYIVGIIMISSSGDQPEMLQLFRAIQLETPEN